MTREVFEKVRDIDHLVLQHIHNGRDDVHQISQATPYNSKKIGYSFNKLEKLSLLQVEHPDGMTERIVDGQKRVFRKPRQGTLTELGKQYLAQAKPVNLERYEEMTNAELIGRVLTLEEQVASFQDQVNELEETLEIFRKQTQRHLG